MMTDDSRMIEVLGYSLFICGAIALLMGLAINENPQLSGILFCLFFIGIGFLIILIGSQIPTRKELHAQIEKSQLKV